MVTETKDEEKDALLCVTLPKISGYTTGFGEGIDR